MSAGAIGDFSVVRGDEWQATPFLARDFVIRLTSLAVPGSVHLADEALVFPVGVPEDVLLGAEREGVGVAKLFP